MRRKSQLGVSEVARVMKCHDVMNQCIAMTHVNLSFDEIWVSNGITNGIPMTCRTKDVALHR
jgi:hypothetical protein